MRTIRTVHGPYVGAVTSDMRSFDKAIGTEANLTSRYLGWGSPTPTNYIEQSAQVGVQVLIVLLPSKLSLQQIVAGQGDAYLHALATAIRDTHDRVLLSFGPEMDGRWYRWGYGHVRARLFVRAWRHVHDVMDSVADGDISWVWQVSWESGAGVGPLAPFWPGNKYVSIIGLDGYFYYPDSTFDNVFAPTIRDVRKFTNRPILITETAIGPTAGQARKIPGLFAGLRAYHLLGFIWFDHDQSGSGSLYKQDWQIEGHRAALHEFRTDLRRLSVSK